METLLANVLVIGAFAAAYYFDKKKASRAKIPPQLYPLPVRSVTNPEDHLCKCYDSPTGTYPVFVAGPEVITVKVESKPSYHCQGRTLKMNSAGKSLKMAWRISYPFRQAKLMEKHDDGTWRCEWIFEDESCSCGPETIYHNPGRCAAVYSPAKQSLTLEVVKESKNLRIGPP